MSFLGIISKLLNSISYEEYHVFLIDIWLFLFSFFFFLLVTKAAMNICIQIFVLLFLLTKYLGALNHETKTERKSGVENNRLEDLI